MKRMRGLTIVQLMVLLLGLGVAGYFLVNFLIEKRCNADPAASLCSPPVRP